MIAARFEEAQRHVASRMEGVLDDDMPDKEDDCCVSLMDEYGLSDAEAEAVLRSEWYKFM